MANMHDTYRVIATQNVAYAAAGGSSAQSSAFSSQTLFIRVSAAGLVDSTNTGYRYALGSNPVASATSTLLPLNLVSYIKCTPGQRLAVLGASAATGSLSISEMDG
jgi:hypothetical protein